MIIHKSNALTQQFLQNIQNQSIGFIPTMGALHRGHIALIQICKKNNHLTVCSIFVNPTQFNDIVDFEKYPVKLEEDILMLEEVGCDVLFLPSVEEMYPINTPKLFFDLGYLENILEGKYRSGHFQGVCQVINRFLEIINPDFIYLGQKDFQQCMVVKKLLQIRNSSTELIICPTIREKSGLAMSSRNARLDSISINSATAIFQAMVFAKENLSRINFPKLKEHISNDLKYNGFEKIDYVSICNGDTLEELESFDSLTPTIILIELLLEAFV
jgi:pantoate--beta-alanine ligase